MQIAVLNLRLNVAPVVSKETDGNADMVCLFREKMDDFPENGRVQAQGAANFRRPSFWMLPPGS